MENVGIYIESGDNRLRVITDENGEFTKQVPAGNYTVTPFHRHLEFDPASATVEVPMAEGTQLMFVSSRVNNA
ncbi:hypothetical protein JW859_10480 [bacterium]|nr:hypothetical protein [bacterium]